jgi:3-oxoacyl-[acyl-carrier protein] reductase
MTRPLAGKVALVTGGARGIGAAIVERRADDGADVAFSCVASADRATALANQLAAKGVRVESFQADQADPAAVAALVDTVAEKFGRIDILVNSAGVFVPGAVGAPDAPPADAFARQLAVNVTGGGGAGHARLGA